VIAELDEADLDAGADGFLSKWTEAWGKPCREPTALGGTFAVSFLLSVESEAGAMAGTPATDGVLGAAGEIDADGNTVPGGFGASGGTPASEAGFAAPGGTPNTEGGFGAATAPGAVPATEGGFNGAAAIGGAPIAEGSFGAGGASPGIDGGFGAVGGVADPATGGIPGGLGSGGIAGGTTAEGGGGIDPGAPGF